MFRTVTQIADQMAHLADLRAKAHADAERQRQQAERSQAERRQPGGQR